MKKEIRIYFNLEKELDIKAYENILDKKSASAYIIDLINKELKKDTNILAEKLDSIVYAINNLQAIQTGAIDVKINRVKNEIALDLTEEFNDEY